MHFLFSTCERLFRGIPPDKLTENCTGVLIMSSSSSIRLTDLDFIKGLSLLRRSFFTGAGVTSTNFYCVSYDSEKYFPVNWSASFRWSSSLYCPVRDSDEMTIWNMHSTLSFINKIRKHSFVLDLTVDKTLAISSSPSSFSSISFSLVIFLTFSGLLFALGFFGLSFLI